MYKAILTTGAISFALAGAALAGSGGKPAAHSLSGADWGGVVSSTAKEGGLGDHASSESGGGKPAAHDKSGREWGSAVNEAAKGGGLGGHASGKE